MRLSIKIWLPTVLFCSALAVLGCLAVWHTQARLGESVASAAEQQSKIADSQSWSALTQGNAIRTQAMLQSADPALNGVLSSAMAETSKRITEIQQRISARAPDAGEKRLLDRIDGLRKAYISVRDAARKLKADGQADAARSAWANDVQAPLAAYLASQQSYVEFHIAKGNALRAAMAAEQIAMLWSGAAAVGLLSLAMFVTTGLLVRSICQPLAGLAGVAQRIGEGDLTVELDIRRHDEVGAVMRSLAQMRDALRGIVAQVRQSAESIQSASAEVASGNLDLSQRTEHTASSLQRTAGSIKLLTGHVQQSAEAANEANRLAASASTVATKGGEMVAKVVRTMDEINVASKRIADIIGTIDGIAFQTNILALNAAVEAARAGEQGRGFAVVAGEVRSLAQRSADAAREIKGLISASVERVDIGAKLVGDAGATMTDIVSSVQRVSDIIAAITAASGEQSSGINEVNGAIGTLDQMTQQNAALVEQSAAASENLRDQARRLTQAIAVFRIAEPAPTTLTAHTAPVTRTAPTTAQAKLSSAVVRPTPAPRLVKPVAPKRLGTPAPSMVTSGADDAEWESF